MGVPPSPVCVTRAAGLAWLLWLVGDSLVQFIRMRRTCRAASPWECACRARAPRAGLLGDDRDDRVEPRA